MILEHSSYGLLHMFILEAEREMQRKGRRKPDIYYHYSCQGEETLQRYFSCLSKAEELPLS